MLFFTQDLEIYTMIIIIIILLLISIFFIYQMQIWSTARYFVDEKNLKYKFGPFNGSILINDITTIAKSNYPTSGINVRPSLNLKGLLIHYKTGEAANIPRKKLYISPLDEKKFIRAMRKINPRIKKA